MIRRPLVALAAALVLASVALGADRAAAKRALEAAVREGSAEGIQRACDELIEAGDKASLQPILALLPKAEGATYWQLVGGASGFKDRPALEELGRFVIASQDGQTGRLSRDLVFALGNNGSPLVVVPLAVVLEKGKYDLQLMAVDQLALVRTVESVDALIAAAKREARGERELVSRTLAALGALTGENLGDGSNWEGWWREQRAKGLPARKAKDAGGSTKLRDDEFKKTIERISDKRIVVLSAEHEFDDMSEIVEKHKIPHTVVKRNELDAAPEKYLKECACLLVNCADYEKCPLAPATLERIRAFVERDGGYLYTEDWGLIDVTQLLFPDKVATGQPKEPRLVGESTVKLSPGRGNTSHPLMRGVWQKAVGQAGEDGEKTVEKKDSPAKLLEHTWKVDDQSAAIEINDAQGVVVLLEAADLAKQTGGHGSVAVTFRAGKGGGTGKQATGKATGDWSLATKGGRVLHTLSHWGHQSESEDGQALHNLLINFLLEGVKRRELVGDPKK